MCKNKANSALSTAVAGAVALCALAGPILAADAEDVFHETRQQRDQRMEWWRDARCGMFIHWGLYAVPAGQWNGKPVNSTGEWIMNSAHVPVAEYEKFSEQFNPVKFDAEDWVQTAKNAGMKYIIITSKHHDGFCLWDSDVTSYDIIDTTPFDRDILKELSEACSRSRMRLGFYHSIMDWHHPDAQAPFYPNYNDTRKSNPNFSRYVSDYLKPQIRELLTGYGNIDVMWFDGEWIADWNDERGRSMYKFVRTLRPDIIINNRVGKGRKGMQGTTEEGFFAGDFGTPEQEIPATGLPGQDWETCMTMNDTWGYRSDDNNWKSSEDLIRKLVDIASKGGNFLLNVGPTAEGLIPKPSLDRLRSIGDWMKVNGESIYGTTANPIGELSWGRCTAKGDKLYLHVFDWPADNTVTIPAEGFTAESAHLLADGSKIELTTKDTNIVLRLPQIPLDPVDTVIVLNTKKGQ
jgi:alpha-L-fucosidase